MLGSIFDALVAAASRRERCVSCGKRVSPRDRRMALRGGGVVHETCATYESRSHRR